jgi:signal transduction histidine kinase
LPRSIVSAGRFGLPRRTARLRLTLLYAGLFLVLGTAVIAITYLLARGGATIRVRLTSHPAGQVTPAASAVLPNETLVAGASARGVNQIRQVATNQHDADLRHLLEISWLVLAVTTLGAAVLGWFAAGRLLAPLRSITATARTISAGSLDQRLALAGPDDEFKQLGDTLDDLFGRLEASFDAQRRFVANASHELRTPLTVERTLLQVALSDPNATQASLRAACEELLASQTEHAHLLESLLTLATSERGLERREALELSVLASDTLHEFGASIARRELRVAADLEAAPTVGDPALLARLVANLVDNAVEYSVDRGTIEIRTTAGAGQVHLSVSNTGALIPAADTERLLEPFQRLNPRRADASGHHGLGLSIVQAIATAHGASVAAQPRPGGGLTVLVDFIGAGEPADRANAIGQPARA